VNQVLPGIMQNRSRRAERQQQQGQWEQSFAADEAQNIQSQTNWQQSFDATSEWRRGEIARQKRRDETDAKREESRIARETMRTRDDAAREALNARFSRARTVQGRITASMSPAELEHEARLGGFESYAQYQAVLQGGQGTPQQGLSGYPQMPIGDAAPPSTAPVSPYRGEDTSFERFPGETGLGRINRLRGAYDMPISELARRVRDEREFQTLDDDPLRDEVRRTLGGR